MKIIGYLRLSKDDENDCESTSITNQRKIKKTTVLTSYNGSVGLFQPRRQRFTGKMENVSSNIKQRLEWLKMSYRAYVK